MAPPGLTTCQKFLKITIDRDCECENVHSGYLLPQSCLCPAGLAISPNLLCYQWLEVYKYVGAIDASHIR